MKETLKLPVTQDHLSQFHEEGYFVLDGVIPTPDLADLRNECQKNLDAQIADMERVGAETLGLSHKGKRYSLPCRHEDSPALEKFLFGDLMMDITGSVLGPDVYLYHELFVVKWRKAGLPFAWHQDSGYLIDNPHKPFLTLWCALDDMTEENGALRVLPYSRTESRAIVRHQKDKAVNDLVGYQGSDPGIALTVPSGSIVAFSSTTFHCSGSNITDTPRRAFLASYSPEPITDKKGNLYNLAAPFIQGGQRVT